MVIAVDKLRAWGARVAPWWEQRSPSQRRNLIIAAGAGVCCLAVVGWLLLRPNYVTVMTGLDDKSLGQVQSKLQDLKIPNKIQGSSVLVPARDADTARVQLAMAGLPKSGYIGYSSIPNSFAMTQDQFNVQVLDVLQQSLAQTIESIDGVESAQVHIVMPQQQLFVSQPTDQAKASVFVQLGPGVQLSAAQVAGIQQLVAHAVRGLAPADVAVVDQNGVSLSNPATPAQTGSASAQAELTLRRQLEQSLTQQLTSGLAQIVGPGNAVVMVHANVTFNQVQQTSHVFQPAPGQTTGLPNSTQVTRKSTTNSTPAGGVAGQSATNPNLPAYAGTGASAGNVATSETDTVTKYDNSYTDTVTQGDPMQIQGYTVGVFLNSDNAAITPAVVSQIKSFVANAVGMQPGAANNSITVATIPFRNQSVQTQRSNWRSVPWWEAAGGAAALLALAAGVWVWRRRQQAVALQAATAEEVAAISLEELPVSEDERIKEELTRFADRKPAEFASLLRTWLASD
ncbi:MAG: flagellar M-ring protein FliF [Alicyclobacillus sp.]|nr:flagellar M-ring protein FliF [Alicyclobacillus sp.]